MKLVLLLITISLIVTRPVLADETDAVNPGEYNAILISEFQDHKRQLSLYDIIILLRSLRPTTIFPMDRQFFSYFSQTDSIIQIINETSKLFPHLTNREIAYITDQVPTGLREKVREILTLRPRICANLF